ITFRAPAFRNGRGDALAAARQLHAGLPSVTFDFTAKVDHLLKQRARLPDLADLGCAFIITAAESLSDTVLANLAKGHTRADILAALHAVRAAGIALRPTWVPFTPWTTLDDYRELLHFVEAHALIDAIDPVQFSIRLLVPPGSLLLESPAMRPFLGPLVEDAFYYRWTHPDPRMERLATDVAALAARAVDAREDAAATFNRIRGLADAAAGASPGPGVVLPPARTRPPRLTEPRSCWGEPTQGRSALRREMPGRTRWRGSSCSCRPRGTAGRRSSTPPPSSVSTWSAPPNAPAPSRRARREI